MNNCDKLLRAFIEAQGYEVEVIVDREEIPISKYSGGQIILDAGLSIRNHKLVITNQGQYKRGDDDCYYLKALMNTDYKVTKKSTPVNAIESLRHVIELNEHRMNNARLCFYSFKTYQPKDSYLDENESIPHAQPIVASCKGKFPDVWLKKPYKVVLSDMQGKDIFEKDYHEEI